MLEKAEAEGGVEGILDLKVIDPACGSGHFLLGAARRMATRVAQLRDADAPDYNGALREVVSSCIHGVDRNPMAVELAKVALWIESVSPGQPLGFLDANVRCGDALLGVFDLEVLEQGIPDDAYKPLTGDDKEATKYYKAKNKNEKKGQGSFDYETGTGAMPPRKLAANLSTIRRMPENTVRDVGKKRQAFDAWRHKPERWATKVACDLYTAAFLLPKVEVPENYRGGLVPTTADVWKKLGGGSLYGPLEAAALDAAEGARALHWPLAFPDVLIGKGGFDVVLGNPPWEVVELKESEFFESRAPEISSLKSKKRKEAIARLASTRPEVFSEFETAKHIFDAMNEFARASGRFDLTARGKINTYALFADLFLSAAGVRGQAGLIVPTGIATDATTAPFFGHLVSGRRLARLFDFENRERLFEDVDSRVKFCLLTLGSDVEEAEFSFFLTDPAQLEDNRRRFALSPQEIARINPNTRTAPVFRSIGDARLVAEIYARVPVLISDNDFSSNSWSITYSQGFKVPEASSLGELTETSGLGFLHSPLRSEIGELVWSAEPKNLWHFDNRWQTWAVDGYRYTSEQEKEDVDFSISCENLALASQLVATLDQTTCNRQWAIAYRRITGVTNERTFVVAPVPVCAFNDNHGLLLSSETNSNLLACLISNLSSLTFDFVVRSNMGGGAIAFVYVKQFPILPPQPTLKPTSPSSSRVCWSLATPIVPWRPSRATSATTARPSLGMRSAARSFVPNSMPGARSPTASPGTSCATCSILRT